MTEHVCIYCDAPAVRWCDYILGFTDPDGDSCYAFDEKHTIERCDAGLCMPHARHVGNFFASGKAGWAETIDYCHTHPLDDWWGPASLADIERWRIQHRRQARGLRVVENAAV